MEEDTPPVGTRVVVFRLDGKTKVGEGTIEEWMLFEDIEDDSDEDLANTSATGIQPEFNPDEIVVFLDDGSELSWEDALQEIPMRTPRIKLDSGETTYGSCCFWQTLKEYQESGNN